MDLAYILAGGLIMLLPAINHGIVEYSKPDVEIIKEYYDSNNEIIRIERSYTRQP